MLYETKTRIAMSQRTGRGLPSPGHGTKSPDLRQADQQADR